MPAEANTPSSTLVPLQGTVLGIETSCDETSAAVVTGTHTELRLIEQVVLSQVQIHRPYGGVVPEIACRSHVESLSRVVEDCLERAAMTADDIDAVAVAYRPGLIGALLVGLTTAKSLAWAWNKPLIGVHHLEAHLEAPLLSPDAGTRPDFPYLGVIVSGGHTDLYHVRSANDRTHLGGTQDDAIGEAFDKVASILGLPYPGGPEIEKCAQGGDASAVDLPRSMLATHSLDFSFSGIKTSVLYKWRGQNAKLTGPIEGAPSREDICASFQAAVVDVLIEKIRRALRQTDLRRVVLGGGVTANGYLRQRLTQELAAGVPYRGKKRPVRVESIIFPPRQFSTDNGAMIATLGLSQYLAGDFASLDLEAQPH